MSREIQLTKGYVALVDDVDYKRAAQFHWSAKVALRSDGTIRTVYARRNVNRADGPQGSETLHRFILGITDSRIEVDHRDHNGLNCQRYNLRTATRTKNMQNRRKQAGSSQFKGVTWRKRDKRWYAQISVDTQRIHLGAFSLETEAAVAYDLAASKFFGEFAVLNFPCVQ